MATSRQPKDATRPRVSHEEAAVRLIEATIELLRELPIPQVTTRRIAERAGLSMMAIARNFGDQHGLLAATANELANRFASAAESSARATIVFDQNLVLRTKLVAWLLQSGVDPERLAQGLSRPIMRLMAQRQQQLGEVSERTAEVMNELVTVAMEGLLTFGPVHQIDDAMAVDLIVLLGALRIALPEIEQRLGWADNTDNPTTRPSSPRAQ